MKTRTGTKFVVLLFVTGMLGTVGLRSFAATKEQCVADNELRIGIDDNGCITQPNSASKKTMRQLVKNLGLSPRCYLFKFWKETDHLDQNGGNATMGELNELKCAAKKQHREYGSRGIKTSSGAHVTQRVMFANLSAKKKFEDSLK